MWSSSRRVLQELLSLPAAVKSFSLSSPQVSIYYVDARSNDDSFKILYTF